MIHIKPHPVTQPCRSPQPEVHRWVGCCRRRIVHDIIRTARISASTQCEDRAADFTIRACRHTVIVGIPVAVRVGFLACARAANVARKRRHTHDVIVGQHAGEGVIPIRIGLSRANHGRASCVVERHAHIAQGWLAIVL